MQKTNLKTLLSLAVVIIVLGACKPAEKKVTEVFSMDDVVPMKLKGNVKEISFYESPVNPLTYSFDESGKMKSIISKNEDSSVIEKDGSKDSSSTQTTAKAVFVYHYDKNHRLAYIDELTSGIFITSWPEQKKEPFKDTTRLYFNSVGQLIRSSTSPDNEIGPETTYDYDKQGRVIKMRSYTRAVKTEPDRYFLKYNEHGRLIEYIVNDSDDDRYALWKFNLKYTKYDRHGNWIEKMTRKETFKPLTPDTINYLTTRKITYYE
ncbi:hypothetical protein D0C36_23130 [Mucilaginibacter conchicola]|uniref:YD repeat-containing protein n=1 Tax=Mucilaginibacter conchicola TaxID=2303333 RepID=A0A372NMG3_9SPHI|nr:hypothetical protein [Mucilaginibacter conchicola]RFZ90136.1 hypothetical protein D0C36_23130 [Mucilaginibacter conchicola]